MRVHTEITIEVCDDEGDEHEVTVIISGLYTSATLYDPGETPEIEIPEGTRADLHAEIERVAWETWLEDHYQG